MDMTSKTFFFKEKLSVDISTFYSGCMFNSTKERGAILLFINNNLNVILM